MSRNDNADILFACMVAGILIVGSYQIYGSLRARTILRPPAARRAQSVKPRIELSPVEEERLWNDLIEHLKHGTG